MRMSESVKCRFSNAASVLSSKTWKNIPDGGQSRRINPKSLGPVISLFVDAALVRTLLFLAGAPTMEKITKQRIQSAMVASARVAFDGIPPDVGLARNAAWRALPLTP